MLKGKRGKPNSRKKIKFRGKKILYDFLKVDIFWEKHFKTGKNFKNKNEGEIVFSLNIEKVIR